MIILLFLGTIEDKVEKTKKAEKTKPTKNAPHVTTFKFRITKAFT